MLRNLVLLTISVDNSVNACLDDDWTVHSPGGHKTVNLHLCSVGTLVIHRGLSAYSWFDLSFVGCVVLRLTESSDESVSIPNDIRIGQLKDAEHIVPDEQRTQDDSGSRQRSQPTEDCRSIVVFGIHAFHYVVDVILQLVNQFGEICTESLVEERRAERFLKRRKFLLSVFSDLLREIVDELAIDRTC